MPDQLARILVVDHVVARAAGLGDHPGARAVPAPSRRAGRLDSDRVLEVLDDAGPGALVLARPPWSDAATAPLPAMAVVLGIDLLWLPPGIPSAAWAAALITAWARTTPSHDLLRRAQVAVGLAAMPADRLPMRAWGPDGIEVPAMSPDSLARWCDCAWCACAWCDQGGLPGAACPACGQRAR